MHTWDQDKVELCIKDWYGSLSFDLGCEKEKWSVLSIEFEVKSTACHCYLRVLFHVVVEF